MKVTEYSADQDCDLLVCFAEKRPLKLLKCFNRILKHRINTEIVLYSYLFALNTLKYGFHRNLHEMLYSQSFIANSVKNTNSFLK